MEAFAVDLAAVLTTLENGKSITTFPQNPEAAGAEGVEMGSVSGSEEYFAMGHSYQDEFNVNCRMWARVPDTTAVPGKPSRDRMVVMLDAVEQVLTSPTSTIYTGGHAHRAVISRYEMDPRREDADNAWLINAELTVTVLAIP